jgi:integrase
VGWEIIDEDTGKLKQLYEPLGYYKTRPEALIALADYHKNPNSLDASTATFANIYERWSGRKFTRPKTSKQSIASYKASYKEAKSLHDMKFVDIKKDHLQAVIDGCENKVESLNNIKLLFRQLFKYARENDIVEKDYSEFVEIDVDKSESTRSIFTLKERDLLWANVDKIDFIDTVLIMIYSGLRPGELLELRTDNIEIEQQTMRGGIKTNAGKNRIIPINEKILPFIAKRKAEGHEFLIHHDDKQMSYYVYYNIKWKEVMDQLQMAHKPHDCRHTFATMMDKAKADKLCIKRIMGHAVKDITENIYTHKDIEDLIEAIDLI